MSFSKFCLCDCYSFCLLAMPRTIVINMDIDIRIRWEGVPLTLLARSHLIGGPGRCAILPLCVEMRAKMSALHSITKQLLHSRSQAQKLSVTAPGSKGWNAFPPRPVFISEEVCKSLPQVYITGSLPETYNDPCNSQRTRWRMPRIRLTPNSLPLGQALAALLVLHRKPPRRTLTDVMWRFRSKFYHYRPVSRWWTLAQMDVSHAYS